MPDPRLVDPRDVLAHTAAPAAFKREGTAEDSKHFAERRAEALALADRQVAALAEIGINLGEGTT